MLASDYFAQEIAWIHNHNAREFALKYVDEFPPYFMTKPASSTGKYHAPWSNIVGSEDVAGGLARHVKAMCYCVYSMAEAEMLTSDELDASLLATLGHDAVKYGLGGGRYTTKTHEIEGAVFFKRCIQKHKAEFPLRSEIYKAIAFHQGKWAEADPPKRFPEDFDKVGQMVHRADMIASRSAVEFTFIKDEEGSFFG